MINWDIIQPVNPLERYAAGFDRGSEQRDQRTMRNALADFARDPTNPAPINAMMPIAPQMAMRLRTDQQTQAREGHFAGAAGRYAASMRGRPGAQAGVSARIAPPEQPGGPSGGGVVEHPALTPMPGGSNRTAGQDQPQPPANDADAAFLEMVQIDPVRAFQIDSAARDAAAERLGMVRDGLGTAGQIIGSATDEATYQQAVANAEALLSGYGMDVRSMVPPNYPGPDGIRALQMRAMEASDQLAALDRRDRLEADIADDDADNVRADRMADNRISTNNVRTRIAASREARVAAGRVSNGGRRRGRGGRGRGRGGNGPAEQTATGPNGQRLVLRGGRWVPLN